MNKKEETHETEKSLGNLSEWAVALKFAIFREQQALEEYAKASGELRMLLKLGTKLED